tara:strand:+ start:5552 stop:6043 length:492 start_codon:yes stop_codon:yes gene_type:complete
MPGIATVIGLSLTAIGTGVGIAGAVEAQKAGKEARTANRLRQQQMNLEATRKQRMNLRGLQVAQARAEQTASNQGSGESSALSGALGTIAGSANSTMLATSQNTEIGNQLFESAGRMASIQSNSSFLKSTGSGLSSLGGSISNNSGKLNKLGAYFSRPGSIFS